MGMAEGFFDNRAETWEKKCYPPEVRRRLLNLLPDFGVQSGERVLDIGTGSGILIPYLLERAGNKGRVCALDLSFEMVRQARLKIYSIGDIVMRADVHQLPFKNESHDRVICFAAFPHFSRPREALGEMSRVLAPGGTLVVAHLMSRRELAAHHGTHSAVARDLLPDAADFRKMFEDANLTSPRIVDEPGRYLAVGVRRTGREPCERFRSASVYPEVYR